MKTLSYLLLGASLVANAILAFLYLHPSLDDADSRAAAANRAKMSAASAGSATGKSALPAGPEKIDLAAILDSKDNREIVAALRRAGFPERVILWVIGEKVDAEIFRPRNRERRGTDGPLPYWDPRGALSSQAMAERFAMQKERRELLKQLVGTEFWDEQNSMQSRALSFLPADKVGAVSQIVSDYQDMYSSVRQDMMMAQLPEDKEKLKLLYTERQADLARVLSPEELQLYELYASPTARNLKFALGSFQPTEAEFRAMFDARKASDDASGALYGYYDFGNYEARQEAQKAVEAQYKAALGDMRYAQYQRETDYGYQAATKIVQHYNLPAQNAADAYEVQRAALAQANDQRTSGQDAQATRAALTALAAQTSAKLQALLGPDGFAAYKRTGGNWLGMMERGFAPPTTGMSGGIIIMGGF